MHKCKFVQFMMGALACGLAIGSCGPPLELTPASLPNAAVGVAYSQALSSDSDRGADWRVVGGELPGGLELGTQSGVIFGTPSAAGVFEFTVRATDGGRRGTIAHTLVVVEGLSLDTSLSPGRVGEVYSDALAATGGTAPYTFEIVGLPAGIALDADTGELSGTPIYAITGDTLDVTVTDSGSPQQTVSRDITFVVKPRRVQIVTESLPDATIGSTDYSVFLEAEEGDPPYRWAVVEGAVSGAGLELVLETGEIRNRRDSQTGRAVAIPEDAASAAFTIEVTDSDASQTSDRREFTINVVPSAP